jgi:hypothetical protein
VFCDLGFACGHCFFPSHSAQALRQAVIME